MGGSSKSGWLDRLVGMKLGGWVGRWFGKWVQL